MTVEHHNVVHRVIAGVVADIVNAQSVGYVMTVITEVKGLARVGIYKRVFVNIRRSHGNGIIIFLDYLVQSTFREVIRKLSFLDRSTEHGGVTNGSSVGRVDVYSVACGEA